MRGVPNDPAAYAAKRAAISEAKRAAKVINGEPVKPAKRKYTRRTPVTEATEVLPTFSRGVRKDVEKLEEEIEFLRNLNEQLRVRTITAENRLMTLLDLITKAGL